VELGAGDAFTPVDCLFTQVNQCTIDISKVKEIVEIGSEIRVRVAAISDFGMSERSAVATRLLAFRPDAPTLQSDAEVTNSVTIGLKWTNNSDQGA
jgi:hypothetical protein